MSLQSHKDIIENIYSNPKYLDMYNIINPILFDTTLRDGIQNANPEHFSTECKQTIFHNIITNYKPQTIEIGSLTNPKILPIMNDTLLLHDYSQTVVNENIKEIENLYWKNIKIMVLVPTITKLLFALENKVRHFSFITSVSNEFQLKNTNSSLEKTKANFHLMFDALKREPDYKNMYKKLYISCIDRCPISGKIDNHSIINEICYYYCNFEFNELCISDTMGELSYENFVYILDNCIKLGIPRTLFSIHLHVSKQNIHNAEGILFYCFENSINKFDVSLLDTGGCSVTMSSHELKSNLTYDLFYKILLKYLASK
jgi:hypothetical protein